MLRKGLPEEIEYNIVSLSMLMKNRLIIIYLLWYLSGVERGAWHNVCRNWREWQIFWDEWESSFLSCSNILIRGYYLFILELEILELNFTKNVMNLYYIIILMHSENSKNRIVFKNSIECREEKKENSYNRETLHVWPTDGQTDTVTCRLQHF